MTALVYDSALAGWLCFDKPIEVVQTYDREEVLPSLRWVEEFVCRHNSYAVGFIGYEASPAFDSALHVRSTENSFPLLWFGLFEKPEPFQLACPISFTQLPFQPTVSREEYDTSINRIMNLITEGDTYQVNYSFRLKSRFDGDPFEFFLQLINAQPSSNGAFIATDDFAICSASPELFFSLTGERIVTRPMKGTVPRGLTSKDDKRNAESLRYSEKNRAENLMIVDMMRNDIGRIAETGSVRVPALFDIEKYPTVWQMTSTVEAKTNASVTDIVSALFPCGSITGAPKARTMEIIAELESTPRKIYTGAIGFIAPHRKAQFNVAIRTVLIDKKKGEAEYGVGGGIVWASEAQEEYEECLAKSRVLTDVRPQLSLFETILYTSREGFFLLDEHLARLKDSAGYFDFPFNEGEARSEMEKIQNDATETLRLKLTLAPGGSFSVTALPFDAEPPSKPLHVRLAASPIDSQNLFLYHKTTHRSVYDLALASAGECDDVILWNERGEVTESTIANIVVEVDGEMVTPPVECGLLAGTFRAQLRKEGRIKERRITREEFAQSSRIFLINSLRTWRETVLVS